MNKEKLYLINKLFNNKTIRTVWNEEEEKYYVSVLPIEETGGNSGCYCTSKTR